MIIYQTQLPFYEMLKHYALINSRILVSRYVAYWELARKTHLAELAEEAADAIERDPRINLAEWEDGEERQRV